MRTVAPARTATVVVLATLIVIASVAALGLSAQEVTPEAPFRCDDIVSASLKKGTPANELRSMTDAGVGTPLPNPKPTMADQAIEFDQVYIDLMIPHHASIIALAMTALPHLSDE